ncbi:AAA family ATPase, partial [Spongiibacter tropicus]
MSSPPMGGIFWTGWISTNLPPKRIALDEVQRLPELFVSIKQAVDEQRTAGRFLLTGSANALLLPR